MTLPADFDLDEFVRRVLAEDLGSGRRRHLQRDDRRRRALHRRDELPRADRRRRARDRRGLLPRARPRRRRSSCCVDGRRPRRSRHDADAARRQCAGDARRRAVGAQHAPASVGHRDADAALCRRDRGHRRDPARHAQDHSRPARARKICGADGRRAEPPHAARRRRADQGQSCRGVRRRRRGGAPRQGGEHRACRSRSRSTGSTRSSRRWRPAPTGCCSTICRRRCCARRSRWSPAACRSKRRAESTLETIRAIAETGVDYISVGRITQSAPAVDIGLDYALSR